jgi:hypothetical protein
VYVNDSASRAILREHAAALTATDAPAALRLARDVAAVLAAPPPAPGETGPCDHGWRQGRTAAGAFGCVRAVAGARVLRWGRFRPVARYERGTYGEGPGHARIDVSVSGPEFLDHDAVVAVDVEAPGASGNAIADAAPAALLEALSDARGGPLRASRLPDSVVVPSPSLAGSLAVRRRAPGQSYELRVTTRVWRAAPVTRTVPLSERDADRLIRALHDAATTAARLEAAGVEDTIRAGDAPSR